MSLLKKNKSKEVSDLRFINFDEFLMLITTSWDSSLKIFDEQDPDETLLLRKSIGGHFKDDISAMDFSEHLSLIATGSRSGIICIWDFETSKLEGICLGQKRTVTTLNFVNKYPYYLLI
jgi:WD40 repeat protein